jgi:hypothetical protein
MSYRRSSNLRRRRRMTVAAGESLRLLPAAVKLRATGISHLQSSKRKPATSLVTAAHPQCARGEGRPLC